MTTVDVWVSAPGRGTVLKLSNGLFGPASSLMFRLQEASAAGIVEGDWSGASLTASVPGGVLREMLGGLDASGGYASSDDQGKLDAFRQSINDDEKYSVSCIDF